MAEPLTKKTRYRDSRSSRSSSSLKGEEDSDEEASGALYTAAYQRIQAALAAIEAELEINDAERKKISSTRHELEISRFKFHLENEALQAHVKAVNAKLVPWNALFDECLAKNKEIMQRKWSLHFDLLCLNLLHQKSGHLTDLASKLTSYDDMHRFFPKGFANRLGEALLLNNGHIGTTTATSITALSLFLPLLLPAFQDDGIVTASATVAKFIKPLATYIRTSNVLNSIRIRASKPPPQLPYGILFVSANFYPTETITAAEEAYRQEHYPVLVEALLEAVADNAHIANVHYECPAPARIFDLFLSKKSNSLTSLHINFEASHYESSQDCVIVSNALSKATSRSLGGTLERLKIEGVNENAHLVVAILNQLTASTAAATAAAEDDGSTLKELKLVGGGNQPPLAYFQALTAFLQSTSVLEHLELSDSKFVEESMAAFLPALYRIDDGDNNAESSSSKRTISKLSFCGCYFTYEATNLWVDFMNQPDKPIDTTNAKAATRFSSQLRELHFGVNYQVTFEGYNAGPAIAGMLRMHQPKEESTAAVTATATTTIGPSTRNGNVVVVAPPSRCCYPTFGSSQIQSLSLDHFSATCNDFLETLDEYPEQIQLQELRLESVSVLDCHGLAQCVKRVPSIRKVHVKRLADGSRSASTLLNMLRESITLCSFTYDNDHPVFTAEGTRLAQAFQVRNQFFARLLQGGKPSTPLTVLDGTSRAAANAAATTAAARTNTDKDTVTTAISKLHYPSLFQVVHPVPTRQQSQVFLSGMLGLGESAALS